MAGGWSARWAAIDNTAIPRSREPLQSPAIQAIHSDMGWSPASCVKRADPGGLEMKYLVIFERTDTGYGAYAPALPGCVATGQTRDDAARRMKEAIDLHIESLRRHGEPAPPPSAVEMDFIEAA